MLPHLDCCNSLTRFRFILSALLRPDLSLIANGSSLSLSPAAQVPPPCDLLQPRDLLQPPAV